MAILQALNPTNTILVSEDYLLSLCEIIFQSRDFSKIESTIADASKIRFGLKAIVGLTPADDAYNQIIVGLNKLCNVYN